MVIPVERFSQFVLGKTFQENKTTTNQGHERAHQFELLSGLDSRTFSLPINFPFPEWGFHTPRVKQIAVWIFMSFGRKK